MKMRKATNPGTQLSENLQDELVPGNKNLDDKYFQNLIKPLS